MPALSAIQAISPAFEQTRRQLFQPFRMDFWTRLAVVSLVTGEFAGGGCSGAQGFNFPTRGGGRGSKELLFSWAGTDPQQLLRFLPWLLAGLAAVIALGLLWAYIATVYRFILLDAVLTGGCDLGQGWRRRQPEGARFFLWLLGFGLASWAALAILVGGPLFLAWRGGIFREPGQHVVLLVLGGIGFFFLFAAFVLFNVLVDFFSKDFVVPLMAAENLGVWDAWRRLLPMVGAEKSAYAGYALMKIVLAVGSAILFGIVNLIVLLALLIPLAVAGGLGVFAWKALGLEWNLYVAGAAGVLVLAVLALVVFALGFTSAPSLVFFQSYTLHFFGPRYPALAALMGLTPPGPPAAAAT